MDQRDEDASKVVPVQMLATFCAAIEDILQRLLLYKQDVTASSNGVVMWNVKRVFPMCWCIIATNCSNCKIYCDTRKLKTGLVFAVKEDTKFSRIWELLFRPSFRPSVRQYVNSSIYFLTKVSTFQFCLLNTFKNIYFISSKAYHPTSPQTNWARQQSQLL